MNKHSVRIASIKLFVFFLLLAVQVQAVSINVSGTILDSVSNTALPGVIVSSYLHGYRDTTDGNGDFHLLYEDPTDILTPIKSRNKNMISQGVENSLQFQLSEEQTVHLSVFDVGGKELVTLIDKRLQPGSYTAHSGALPSGVYVYNLTTDGKTHAVRFVSVTSGNGRSGLSRKLQSTGTSLMKKQAAPAAAIDTLVIQKSGYVTKKIAFSSSHISDTTILLTPAPTVPAPAAAAGLSIKTFEDTFPDLSSIDVNNTKKPGFKWYVDINYSNDDPPPSTFTLIDNGEGGKALRIERPSGNTAQLDLLSAQYDPPDPSTQGRTFNAGKIGAFYVEGRLRWPKNSGVGEDGFPAFWMNPVQTHAGQIDFKDPKTGGVKPFVEIDIMEWNPDWGNTSTKYHIATHYWYRCEAGKCPDGSWQYQPVGQRATSGVVSGSLHVWNVFGVLVDPGPPIRLKYYVNNKLQHALEDSGDYTTNTASKYPLWTVPLSDYILLIGSGEARVEVDWVRVWRSQKT